MTDGQKVTILMLGTSLSDVCFQSSLIHALNQSKSQKFEFLNRAQPGATSREAISKLEKAEVENASIVLIEFVAGDANIRHRISPKASYHNHRCLVQYIHYIVPRQRIIMIINDPSWGWKRAIRPSSQRYADNYRRICEWGSNISYIDIMPTWAVIDRRELKLLVPDGLHPTKEANQKLVIPKILECICQCS